MSFLSVFPFKICFLGVLDKTDFQKRFLQQYSHFSKAFTIGLIAKTLKRNWFFPNPPSNLHGIKPFRPVKKKTPNYLVIVYIVKKFIQSLKSYIKVKRILKITPYHLNLLNDVTSFYKDGNEIGNSNELRSLSNMNPNNNSRGGQRGAIFYDAAEKMRIKKYIEAYNGLFIVYLIDHFN